MDADATGSSVSLGTSVMEEKMDDQSEKVVDKPLSLQENLDQITVGKVEKVADTRVSQNKPVSEEKMDDQSENVSNEPELTNLNLVQITVHEKEEMAADAAGSFVSQDTIELEEKMDDKSENVVDKPELVSKNLVQITVDEDVMKRRISTFIFRKRKEIDRRNVEEFCGRRYIEEDDPCYGEVDTCARIDAIHFPRFGGKSRVKVSKVENKWGPQTRPMFEGKKIKKEPGTETIEQADSSLELNEDRLKNVSKVENKWSSQAHPMFDAKKIKKEPGTEVIEQEDCLEIIEERLQNMESHLKIKTDSSLRHSIFQRLKNLEDRILLLESISPEYFHFSGPKESSPKKKTDSEKEKLYSNWGVDDLQKRIKYLQKSLKTKSVHSKKDKKD